MQNVKFNHLRSLPSEHWLLILRQIVLSHLDELQYFKWQNTQLNLI